MGQYNFQKDLKEGLKGENKIIEYLESIGGKLINTNNDKDYDALIKYKDKLIKYEIKTDVYCVPHNDTGNMFIEFECRGKPSGIMTSKSDWFVMYYKYLKQIWFIKTDNLIDLLKDNFDDIPKTIFSGDKNSNTKGFLLARNNYKKHFIIKKI